MERERGGGAYRATENVTDRKRRWADRDPGAGSARRAALVAGALLILVWGGCSVEKHYELLSFFFDGVPEPLTPEMQALADRAGGGSRLTAGRMASAHTAYLDRRCVECHGDQANFGFTTTGFSDLGEQACLRCHDQEAKPPAFEHGPVALGACLVCHDAHASLYPVLLVKPSPALCLDCHDPQLGGVPSTPGHEDPSRDCLECHYGHGGERHYLLRNRVDPDT
jgi:predicted CXXCH cytochrome family protein